MKRSIGDQVELTPSSSKIIARYGTSLMRKGRKLAQADASSAKESSPNNCDLTRTVFTLAAARMLESMFTATVTLG